MKKPNETNYLHDLWDLVEAGHDERWPEEDEILHDEVAYGFDDEYDHYEVWDPNETTEPFPHNILQNVDGQGALDEWIPF